MWVGESRSGGKHQVASENGGGIPLIERTKAYGRRMVCFRGKGEEGIQPEDDAGWGLSTHLTRRHHWETGQIRGLLRGLQRARTSPSKRGEKSSPEQYRRIFKTKGIKENEEGNSESRYGGRLG